MSETNQEELQEINNDVSVFLSYISPFGIFFVKSIQLRMIEKDTRFTFERINTIISHLKDYGFIVYRFDDMEVGLSIELTERGRILKALGTIDDFNKYTEERMLQELRRQQLSDRLLESNIINGSLTKRLYYVNIAIAVATAVAALYYLLSIQYLLKDKNPALYNTAYPYWVTGCMALGTTGILVGIWHILKQSRKDNI